MIARAKRLDNKNAFVKGYYTIIKDMHAIKKPSGYKAFIDPSTLEYLIKDKWYSMQQLEALVTPPKPNKELS